MANIFLTSKCNLNCPYCFASKIIENRYEDITIANFCKALNFIKSSKNEPLGLIGGEPLLHDKFEEIIYILNKDDSISNYIIYTNGIELDKYIKEFQNKKVKLLINCNSPDITGTLNYEKLKKNIKILNELNLDNYVLGINLYSPNVDFSYIFELLNISNSNRLRFSVAIFGEEKDGFEFLRKIKPYIINFLQDCLYHNVIPNIDCCSIPDCLLNTEDKKLLLKLYISAKRQNNTNSILIGRSCTPVIDIMPDLTALRCLGLSDEEVIAISEFKNPDSLRRYFFNRVDVYARLAINKQSCKHCKIRLIDKCGICIVCKQKEMTKLKNY